MKKRKKRKRRKKKKLKMKNFIDSTVGKLEQKS